MQIQVFHDWHYRESSAGSDSEKEIALQNVLEEADVNSTFTFRRQE